MSPENLGNTRHDQRGFIHKKIGGFIGGAVRGAVGTVGGVLLGGGIPTPISVIQGAVRGALGSRAPRAQRVAVTPAGRFVRQAPILRANGRIQGGQQGVVVGRTREERIFVGPRGQPVGQLPAGQGTQVAIDGTCPPGALCPKGFRVNKTSYFLRDGTFVPRESRCVRIRRRDALNGRAALNSTRRLVAYTKANRRVATAIRAAARATRHR